MIHMRIALFLLLSALLQAAPVTLRYRATVTGFQPGGPVDIGDLVDLTVTYESTVSGFLYADQTWAYPMQSATVQVGDDSVTPDFSGIVNTYVIITNDAVDSAGTSYMDQFMIQIVSTSPEPVTGVSLILRNISSAPSGVLKSNALPLSGPDPAQFKDLSFMVVFAGFLTGGTDQPQLVLNDAVPEPASWLLCSPLIALLIWPHRRHIIR
jgi:hypothetical protein